MTCIVGVLDKANDCVWMGADSLGGNGYTKSVLNDPKLFRNENFKNVVMGSTTSFRHIDLLKYSQDIFPELDSYKKTVIDHKYMVTQFIPRLISLFQDNVKHRSDTDRGANFLVGVGGRLFEIQGDYSVLDHALGICSVGCGEQIAMGSLLTSATMDLPPKERIILALEAAEQMSCGVQRPFKIINTMNDEEIVIE